GLRDRSAGREAPVELGDLALGEFAHRPSVKAPRAADKPGGNVASAQSPAVASPRPRADDRAHNRSGHRPCASQKIRLTLLPMGAVPACRTRWMSMSAPASAPAAC